MGMPAVEPPAAPPPLPPDPAAHPRIPEPAWRRTAIIVASWLVAAGLLTAASAKVLSAGAFLREIENIVDVGRGMTIAAAVFVLLIEFTVGTALLTGWRLRSTAGSAAGLLTFFLCVLVYRLITLGP